MGRGVRLASFRREGVPRRCSVGATILGEEVRAGAEVRALPVGRVDLHDAGRRIAVREVVERRRRVGGLRELGLHGRLDLGVGRARVDVPQLVAEAVELEDAQAALHDAGGRVGRVGVR